MEEHRMPLRARRGVAQSDETHEEGRSAAGAETERSAGVWVVPVDRDVVETTMLSVFARSAEDAIVEARRLLDGCSERSINQMAWTATSIERPFVEPDPAYAREVSVGVGSREAATLSTFTQAELRALVSAATNAPRWARTPEHEAAVVKLCMVVGEWLG